MFSVRPLWRGVLIPILLTRLEHRKLKVRERPEYEMFMAVRAGAERMPAWFGGDGSRPVTGQRREDVARMRFSDIKDDRLYIEQQKLGLAGYSTFTDVESIRPETVDCHRSLPACQSMRFLDKFRAQKNSEDGSINLDSLTKGL